MAFGDVINNLASVGTVIANIAVLFMAAEIVFPGVFPRLRIFVGSRAIIYGFLIAFAAMAGSLIYSDVLGYTPCSLCWVQRIFMYPQIIVLGLALIKREKVIIDYSLVLAYFGAAVAAYQHLLQLGVVPSLLCPVIGSVPSACAQRFVFQFGYITLPFMSFTAFALIIALLTLARVKK